jgi:hypothetical protein
MHIGDNFEEKIHIHVKTFLVLFIFIALNQINIRLHYFQNICKLQKSVAICLIITKKLVGISNGKL